MVGALKIGSVLVVVCAFLNEGDIETNKLN